MVLNHHSTRRTRSRAGYTLVEMLVAAAVSIMIMVILTGAFQAGLDTFRKMRAQGNMNERMRMARTALCDDLASPHFKAQGNGTSPLDYLSGQDLTKWQTSWSPPYDGFFRIWQGPDPDYPQQTLPPPAGLLGLPPKLPCTPEGIDAALNFFPRAKTHALTFTVRRTGAGPDHAFRTADWIRTSTSTPPQVIGPNSAGLIFPKNFVDPLDYREDVLGSNPPQSYFTSQWAEVTWFLWPNGSSAGRLPLYGLMRRQKLLIPSGPLAAPAATVSASSPNNSVPLNDVQVNVGSNGTGFVQAGTNEYNPEMSIRTQFIGQTANYNYFYNRTGNVSGVPAGDNCVTQPRFRFGMQPAHDLQPQPLPGAAFTSLDMPYLAGIPAQIVQSGDFRKTYPTIADELNQYNNTPAAHTQYDMNDLVLSDVVSFEVKVLWDWKRTDGVATGPAPQQYYYIPTGQAAPNNYQKVTNTDYPYDYLPNIYDPNVGPFNQVFTNLGVGVFDTWSQHGPYGQMQQTGGPGQTGNPNWKRTDLAGPNSAVELPLRVKVKAVLIRIRIWDAKAEQTRQITIYQDV